MSSEQAPDAFFLHAVAAPPSQAATALLVCELEEDCEAGLAAVAAAVAEAERQRCVLALDAAELGRKADAFQVG